MHGTLATPFDQLFASLNFSLRQTAAFLIYALAGSFFFIIALIDYETEFIYISLCRALALAAIGLLVLDMVEGVSIVASTSFKTLWLAVLVGALLFFISFVTKGRGFGSGDWEMGFALSLYLPYPEAVAFVIASFWIGALWGIGLLLTRRYQLNSRMPFGPFLVLGFVLALFWGRQFLFLLFPIV